MTDIFDRDCRLCPRLATFLDRVKDKYPDYYCGPVAPFGDPEARFLIVGLAPGMHGANRSGRPFTGDHAGILLYEMLHEFGFGSHKESIAADDQLRLTNCRITNAVKCLPPENKPKPDEVRQCGPYLVAEIEAFIIAGGKALLVLGTVAHHAALKALGLKLKDFPFGHGVVH